MNWTEQTPINTTNLNDLESRINQANQNVTNGKTAIANAITSKGITASSSDPFSTLASKISTPSLVNTADASATSSDIRNGKDGYINGNKITGTLAVQSTVPQTITPTTSNIVKGAGIYDGSLTIAGDPNLVPSNILSGKSIFGVNGSLVLGKKYANGAFNYIGQTTQSITGLTFTPRIILVTCYYYFKYYYSDSQQTLQRSFFGMGFNGRLIDKWAWLAEAPDDNTSYDYTNFRITATPVSGGINFTEILSANNHGQSYFTWEAYE